MKKIERVKSPKLKPTNLYLTMKTILKSNQPILKWSETEETKKNFGDALNPWLFEKITGIKPINSKKIINVSNRPIYSAIGSILDNNKVENLVVWGSGFKNDNALLKKKPLKVCAVRGPLSRKNLIQQGIYCPEVYGDPALLLPKFYNPTISKKYKLGIIPHYVDKKDVNFLELTRNINSDVLIIDIENDIEDVINQILSCELIASSSLHGIIVADAYRIPSLFIKFSDHIQGGDFKFKDYMMSVGRTDINPLIIDDKMTINTILSEFSEYQINIDLNKLLDAFPFNS